MQTVEPLVRVVNCDNKLCYNTYLEPRFLDNSCAELYNRTLNLIGADLIRPKSQMSFALKHLQLITRFNRFSPLLGLVQLLFTKDFK